MTPFARVTGLAFPAALAVLLLLSGGVTVSAQAPDESWRTLSTEHFRVTYPEALRDLATVVADRAERAYEGLSTSFDSPPSASVEIVLTDHADQSNGFARLSPWNRITIFAPPPTEGFQLAYWDDWMELVVTHEMAHIFHLDRRGWLGSVVKAVFGRPPIRWPVFPNSSLPTWTVEGLATYYESRLTDAGRVRGTFHDMALRAAVLEDAFEDLTQVSGETAVWPDGNRPYIYGSLFFDHLTNKYGQERMAEFAAAVDGQVVPFRMNAAARKSFGVTFTDAFAAWEEELRDRYATVVGTLADRAPLSLPEPVATGGRWALFPRVSPDGGHLAFTRSDGNSDTQVHLLPLGGGKGTKLTRTNGLSLLDWAPDGSVVFSQVEFVDPYRMYKDLYVADPGGGVRRVTTGQRLDFPSVSPDGTHALAVQQADGDTWIVSVDLSTGEIARVVEPADDVHWAYPTWSPDGRWIAVSRWEPGAMYDLVLLDSSGRFVAQVTRDRAIDQAPTWSPDGRWLLWASDRTGIPNVFAAEVGQDGGLGSVRQVTNATTGVSYPDVDPGGEWLYVSAYHADGWHIERVLYDPDRWFDPAPTDSRFLEGGTTAAAAYADRIDSDDRPYRAFPALWPRYWEPSYRQGEGALGQEVLGPSFGLQTTAQDMVGRHSASLALRYEPKGSRVEGGVVYSFAGLGNPTVTLVAEQRYLSSGFTVDDESGGNEGQPVRRSLFVVERERDLRANVTLLRRRWRTSVAVTVGAGYVWESRELLDGALEPDTVFRLNRPTSGLPEARITVSFNTARIHPFSISREDGLTGFVRLRRRWDGTVPDSLAGSLGADVGFAEVTGQLRAYKGVRLPGFSNHVFALRGSGGAAGQSGADASHFSIGGASGQTERVTGLELLKGNNLLFPVRGYDRGIRRGRYAWTASAEYRFPLARINRGVGDFPLYFDWISGTLFFDAGNAWGPELGVPGFDNPPLDAIASVGGELVVNGLPLWTASTVLRTGVAVPVVNGSGAAVYVRLGVAF